MAVLDTRYLSMGPRIDAFEEAINEYVGSKYAIGVSSGTSGLHLCIRAAGIRNGDLVLTTPFSFVASTNVILFENAIPIFVDVDAKTGNIDAHKARQTVQDIQSGGKAAQKWLPRRGAQEHGALKGLLSVDVFGQPADYDALLEITSRQGLVLIEDSCEALGATYKGKKAGLFGDSAVFAFYPNKQITTGEGGVIITNDGQAAEFMQALRNQGRAPGDTWLQHTHLGYNYRMDEMSAALGLSQMQRLDELVDRRNQVAGWYSQKLANIDEIETPFVAEETTRMSWFVYVIRIAKHFERDSFANALENAGIPVRPYFLPIHLQPYMMEQFGYQEGDFPITEDLGKRGLALPFSSVMSEEDVDVVCKQIKSCIAKMNH